MTRFALYSYSTENIGDEVQSIAARRFLPQVDAYIDRDRIGEWASPFGDEAVKLLANGWYMRDPFAWPPRDPSIEPLLTSMYIEKNGVGPNLVKPSEVFLADDSRSYLKTHGPVGARDLSTLKLLKDKGVDAYFSGCLTLTLKRDSRLERRDYVLAVDVPDPLYQAMVSRTDRPVIRVSPFGDFSLSGTGRMSVAELFLGAYQSAHAVVTTRLHALLPCLAFETPVLLITEPGKYDEDRYSGLDVLATHASVDEFMDSNLCFDLDDPLSNPDDYRALRRDLIDRCRDFTGYDRGESSVSESVAALVQDGALLSVFFDSFHKRHLAMLAGWEVKRLQMQLDQLAAELRSSKEEVDVLVKERDHLERNYNQVKTTSLYWLIRGIRRRIIERF